MADPYHLWLWFCSETHSRVMKISPFCLSVRHRLSAFYLMLRSLDLGRNSKSEFTVCEIGKKWPFFAKYDLFLTKKWAKIAAFCN
jgi:hypothetical protein